MCARSEQDALARPSAPSVVRRLGRIANNHRDLPFGEPLQQVRGDKILGIGRRLVHTARVPCTTRELLHRPLRRSQTAQRDYDT